MRVKKFVPNKKGDIGMEVYYLCQPNTYVIAITAAHQIHEQWHRCWVDIGRYLHSYVPFFIWNKFFTLSCY